MLGSLRHTPVEMTGMLLVFPACPDAFLSGLAFLTEGSLPLIKNMSMIAPNTFSDHDSESDFDHLNLNI